MGNATPHSAAGADVAELPVDATAMPLAPVSPSKDARRAFYVGGLWREEAVIAGGTRSFTADPPPRPRI